MFPRSTPALIRQIRDIGGIRGCSKLPRTTSSSAIRPGGRRLPSVRRCDGAAFY
jgi:hypothetical protein